MTKRMFIGLLTVLSAVVTMAQSAAPLPSLHVEGKWLVDTYGNHVVLHGVMDTPSMWFNGYDDANGHHSYWDGGYNDTGAKNCRAYFHKIFDGLQQAKCDVFRLHLDPAWTNDGSYQYIDPEIQPKNDKGELPSGEASVVHFNPNRLKTFLKSVYIPLMMDALNHGMYVVVRPPGVCPGEIWVDGYYQKYLMEVWDMVSKDETIQAYAGQISIELANEPVSVKNASRQSDAKALHDFFQPIADKIRENGFTGIIWIPGAGWQSSYADYKTYPITGYNIGYAVHDYDGWYGCEDKKNSASTVAAATKAKINQFHNQVPVVDTNPVIVTEIDWSPKKSDVPGHENEHGQQVEGNLGTWATGRTSVWGTITKNVHDHYGNISMTLSGTHCLVDIIKLLNTGVAEPSFDGYEEACGKACWDWYAEYAKVNNPVEDYVNEAPISDLGDGKYKNPVVRADFPDPDVIRVDNTFYMISTTMSLFPGATILKSKDMVNWEYCSQPLKQLTTTDEGYQLKNNKDAYASGMWAPSMKYYDGKFYVLINEKRPIDGWNLNGWLLTATNPEGPWTAKKLSRSYYDPGMLFDNGKIYVAQGIGNISVCEVDGNFNCKKEVTVISGKDGLEGCHFYKKGIYYYIYATYGGWPSGQAVFRSTDPFGPYEEKMLVEKYINGAPNTIHQGALVDDVKGNWWTIMQQDLGCLGRFPNLQPVKWVSNWPVVGNNGVPYESYTKPATSEAYPLTRRLPTTETFRSYPLGMQWEWNHDPDNDAWSLFERQGWLRIKTSDVVSSLHQARNILTQRIFMNPDKASTGTVRLDVSRLQEGDRAGICIFQDPYAAIAVEIKGGQPQIVWWQEQVKNGGNGFAASEKTQAVTLTDNIVYLRGAIKYGENKTKFYYSTDNKTWKQLGNETSQSFNLSVFFGSRFGLFCYSTKNSGATADFDWFSTESHFDEDELYQPLVVTLDEKMYTVKRIVPASKTIETMVGGWRSPGITATYADRHTENVTTQTVFEPDSLGIVEFRNGQMTGVAQGSTRVKASYTDLLGNQTDTAFVAQSSYFPLDPQFITTNLVGQGTYSKYNSYSIFKFSEEGQMGWVYPSKMDFSDYKYLVVNLYKKQTANAHLNIYTSAKTTGACHSTEKFGDSLQIVVDLDAAVYTSRTSKGRALDKRKIFMVSFTGSIANKQLYLKEMFLSNDSQYAPVGVADLTAEGPSNATTSVYSLSGQLVRRNVERRQALLGLPSGIYIVGNKKVLVK